jgi:hypothetical protein
MLNGIVSSPPPAHNPCKDFWASWRRPAATRSQPWRGFGPPGQAAQDRVRCNRKDALGGSPWNGRIGQAGWGPWYPDRQTGQAEPARGERSTAMAIYRDMAMTCWRPETDAALAEVERR